MSEEDTMYIWLNCEESMKCMKNTLIITWHFVTKDLRNFIIFYIHNTLEIHVFAGFYFHTKNSANIYVVLLFIFKVKS